MDTHPRKQSGLAFTLTELLVVVAVIGILLSMAFPAFESVQRQAKSTQCVHNLRQIGVGMNAFAMDHRMFLAADGTSSTSRWLHQVAIYMGYSSNSTLDGMPVYTNAYLVPQFHCPLTNPADYQSGGGIGTGDGCYGLNIGLVTGTDGVTKNNSGFLSILSLASIVQPAQTVMIAEKSYLSKEGYGLSGPDVTDASKLGIISSLQPYPPDGYGVAANHRADGKPQNGPGGAANYLFCDGHVETRTSWIGTTAFNPWVAK